MSYRFIPTLFASAIAPGNPFSSPPLDVQNGSAGFALALLRAAYAGSPLIRVRRSSDNTESDIGEVSGGLDLSSLLTFCSGTNGFIKTWYDQTGNARDITQTTTANQPQIVTSGALTATVNGNPVAVLTAASAFMVGGTCTGYIGNSEGTAIYAFYPTSITNTSTTPSASHCVWGDTGAWVGTSLKASTPIHRTWAYVAGEASADQAVTASAHHVGAWQHTGGTLYNFLNSQTAGASVVRGATGMTTSVFRLGNNGSGANFVGYVGTMLTYTASVSGANLNSIGSILASYYGSSWS